MTADRKRLLQSSAILAIWTILHLWLSSQRSVWQDELARYVQMHQSVWDSLVSLFKEPSPFSPGEVILGHLSKLVFGKWTSFEFWGRLPVVVWGSLTLAIAVRLRDPFLAAILFFSTSMTSFTTQFRPYGALIFGGALAFRMLAYSHPLRNWERRSIWFSILFGHLYGICFIGFACLLKKMWKPAFFSAGYVVLILFFFQLAHSGHLFVWDAHFNWNFDLRETAQHTMRAVFNPYRAPFFFLPIAILGWLVLFKDSLRRWLFTTLLLLCMLVGPLVANYIGQYYFTPRQIVSLIFPALALTSMGVGVLDRMRPLKKLIMFGLILVMARSWYLYTFEGRPPFADQPLHIHKKLVEKIAHEKHDFVILVDPGGTGYHYFLRTFGEPSSVQNIKMEAFVFRDVTWRDLARASKLRLLHFDQSEFAWRDLNELATAPVFQDFVSKNEKDLDAIIYNSETFRISTSVPLYRAW